MVLVEYPQNIPSNSGYSVIPWPLHCSASVLCPSRAVRSTSLAAMTTAARAFGLCRDSGSSNPGVLLKCFGFYIWWLFQEVAFLKYKERTGFKNRGAVVCYCAPWLMWPNICDLNWEADLCPKVFYIHPKCSGWSIGQETTRICT